MTFIDDVIDEVSEATGMGDAAAGRPLLASRDDAVHLLKRAAFGPTPESIDEVQRMGVEGWILNQLHGDGLLGGLRSDVEMEQRLIGFRTLDNSARANRQLASAKGMGHVPTREIRFASLLHAVYAKSQLREVMVEFWANHFHTDIANGAVRYGKAAEVKAFRAYAFGNFRDLLHASAKSTSMLYYLDNHRSRAPVPNENYGRELLELHTVGAGNHTEADVLNCARVFSGWTLDDYEFAFEPKWHWSGPVSVLDWSNQGMTGPQAVQRGEALLDYLAAHPATARTIARKLVTRFVSDDPPQSLVDHAAQVFLQSGGNIAAVLHTILTSREFWASKGDKLRRPFELIAGALRATDAEIASNPTTPAGDKAARTFEWWMSQLGHPLYQYAPPTGFPDTARAWTSSQALLARWEKLNHLARTDDAHLRIDVGELSSHQTTPALMAAALAERILHRPATDAEHAALMEAVESPHTPVDARWRTRVGSSLLALLLSSPAFGER